MTFTGMSINKFCILFLLIFAFVACNGPEERDKHSAYLSYYLDGKYCTSNGGGVSVNVNYLNGEFNNVIYFLMTGYHYCFVEDQNNAVQFQLVDTVSEYGGTYTVPVLNTGVLNTANFLTLKKNGVGYRAVSGQFDIQINGDCITGIEEQYIPLTGTFEAVMVDIKTGTDTVNITDGKFYYSPISYNKSFIGL